MHILRAAVLLAVIPASIVLASPLRPTFINFPDESSKAKVKDVLPIARDIIQGAWCYLQFHGQDPNPSQLQSYTNIFGKYDKTDYKTVYNHFRAKATDFDVEGTNTKKNSLSYYALDEAEAKDVKTGKARTAFVHANQPGYLVNLGPKFMKKDLASRAHAIVHETMHFSYSVPGESTKRHGANGIPEHETEFYGKTAVKALARKDPHYAIDNADSLATFAVSVHGMRCSNASKQQSRITSEIISILKSLIP
ncbi:hypothetical protein HGRIS_012349 [Hohenbuehelia grisea]|uniref:Lysine-specific metallo-endopeptidase domain-containing protein n=1 Tax=Hohenbuehelia grisea TaxID=104357 RepID=A0ABR3IS20_9AGAR